MFNYRCDDIGYNAQMTTLHLHADAASAHTRKGNGGKVRTIPVLARRSEGRFILDLPLVDRVAKVSGEPESEVLKSCCTCSQKFYRCRAAEFCAAPQSVLQSFMQSSA